MKDSLKEETRTARFEGIRDVKLQKAADNKFVEVELSSMYLCVLYSPDVSKLERYVKATNREEEGHNFLSQGFGKQHVCFLRVVYKSSNGLIFCGIDGCMMVNMKMI